MKERESRKEIQRGIVREREKASARSQTHIKDRKAASHLGASLGLLSLHAVYKFRRSRKEGKLSAGKRVKVIDESQTCVHFVRKQTVSVHPQTPVRGTPSKVSPGLCGSNIMQASICQMAVVNC